MFKSVVCTLFEGDHHFGAATLINSLYINGFRGVVFAGYRGELPAWLLMLNEIDTLSWPGAHTYEVSEGLLLHLLPLSTDYHLTNYKPDFMLAVINLAVDVDAIFYFDPDIVVTGSWSNFEKWVKCGGVALCEDINSPMPETHPRRIAWRCYFKLYGVCLKSRYQAYVNGGFVGVCTDNFEFLSVWKNLQEIMAPAIGGLQYSSLPGLSLPEEMAGDFDPFPKSDQDALNCSIEAWDGAVSFVGKDGMAFQNGMKLMSHAVGMSKPWRTDPLIQLLYGFPPRRVDKDYWTYANYPILVHSSYLIRYRKNSIKIASFLGRFYQRNK